MDRLRKRGRGLASLALALLMLAAMSATTSAAKTVGDWKLKGNFKNAAGTKVKLGAVGLPGFEKSNVKGSLRKALVFDETEGAQLTRVPPKARSTYSILIYFELDDESGYRRVMSFGPSLEDPALYVDNGYLDLYPYHESDSALVDPNEWNRLLITRSGKNDLVRIYLNGNLRIAYVDAAEEFRLVDGKAHFFIDDAGEDGSGTIANIRIWRGVVKP